MAQYTIVIEPKQEQTARLKKTMLTIHDDDEEDGKSSERNIITEASELFLNLQKRRSLSFALKLNQADIAERNYQRKLKSIVKEKRYLRKKIE